MPVELKVPSVGESISEVQIGDWLKSVGDTVNQDDIVVTLETDKVTVELPAPVSGTISQILVKKGETAQVGDILGYLEAGAVAAKAPAAAKDAPAKEAPAASAGAAASPEATSHRCRGRESCRRRNVPCTPRASRHPTSPRRDLEVAR